MKHKPLTPADELAMLRAIDADVDVALDRPTPRVEAYRNERKRWKVATDKTALGTIYLKRNTPTVNPYLRVEREALTQMRTIERTIRNEQREQVRSALPPTAVSLRGYARARGVALSAVQRAIAEGRLTKRSVGRDPNGTTVILDPETADMEWATNTRFRIPNHGGNGHHDEVSPLLVATQREREARANLVELEYQQRAGTLVPAKQVETQWATIAVTIRNGVLGFPTRARQRLPHLTANDLAVLDDMARELLTDMAGRVIAQQDTP